MRQEGYGDESRIEMNVLCFIGHFVHGGVPRYTDGRRGGLGSNQECSALRHRGGSAGQTDTLPMGSGDHSPS